MRSKNMNKYFNLSIAIVFMLVVLGISSCSTKKMWYFRDLKDSTEMVSKIREVEFIDPVIQRYDILSVTVHTMNNDEITRIFAQSGDASVTSNQPGNATTVGYRVDKTGNIELPIIGVLKVEGLTLDQARDVIREKAEKYYISPVVKVRFANYRITVLGDVAQPGQKVFTTEKVTILDLLSQSGDMQISGKRENVLVVRQENGYRSFGRLNMNSSDVFQSPYFYLKSGDVVYVEPNRAKIRSATVDRTNDRFLSYTTTAISLFISLYTFFVIRNR